LHPRWNHLIHQDARRFALLIDAALDENDALIGDGIGILLIDRRECFREERAVDLALEIFQVIMAICWPADRPFLVIAFFTREIMPPMTTSVPSLQVSASIVVAVV